MECLRVNLGEGIRPSVAREHYSACLLVPSEVWGTLYLSQAVGWGRIMQGPAGNGVLEQARGQGYRTSKMRMGPGTSNSRAISAPRHGEVGERATSPEADESQSQGRGTSPCWYLWLCAARIRTDT